jgi:hypothetical protein
MHAHTKSRDGFKGGRAGASPPVMNVPYLMLAIKFPCNKASMTNFAPLILHDVDLLPNCPVRLFIVGSNLE